MGTRWRSQFLHSETFSSNPVGGASSINEPPVSFNINHHCRVLDPIHIPQRFPPADLFNQLGSQPTISASVSTDPEAEVFPENYARMGDRPAIYVHFEFGVSWTPRNAPRNHQLTYMSKSMRDRAHQFPRQIPPANTNFLTAPMSSQPQGPVLLHQSQLEQEQQPTFVQLQSRYQSREPINNSHFQPFHPAQQFLQPSQQMDARQVEPSEQPRRSSRSQSRSSHERGRSAPPPFNDSPWDADPEPMMASALPRSKPRPQIWKALPATPNRYRLGEDDMPWSSGTYPLDYVEDDRSDGIGEGSMQLDPHQVAESPHQRTDEPDRGRTREMQSLATAMMTVDNGFEDQWWYQGSRLVNVAGQLMSPHDVTETYASDGTVGWAVAEDEQAARYRRRPTQVSTPRSSIVDIVSPLSDFPSPVLSYPGLRRSLTTRSDELHIY